VRFAPPSSFLLTLAACGLIGCFTSRGLMLSNPKLVGHPAASPSIFDTGFETGIWGTWQLLPPRGTTLCFRHEVSSGVAKTFREYRDLGKPLYAYRMFRYAPNHEAGDEPDYLSLAPEIQPEEVQTRWVTSEYGEMWQEEVSTFVQNVCFANAWDITTDGTTHVLVDQLAITQLEGHVGKPRPHMLFAWRLR